MIHVPCCCFECISGSEDVSKKILLSMNEKKYYPTVYSPITAFYQDICDIFAMRNEQVIYNGKVFPRKYSSVEKNVKEMYHFIKTKNVEFILGDTENANLKLRDYLYNGLYGEYYGFINFNKSFIKESYLPELDGGMLRFDPKQGKWICYDARTPSRFKMLRSRCINASFETELKYENKLLRIKPTSRLLPDREVDLILYYSGFGDFIVEETDEEIIVREKEDKISKESGLAQSIIKCRDFYLNQTGNRPADYFKITGIFCLTCDKYCGACLCLQE